MTDQIFDVAIVGAGPTGATLALALAQAGQQVCVLDGRDPAAGTRRDGRNFAIVTGSWNLLGSVGMTADLETISQPLNGLEAVDGGTHWFGRPSVLFTKEDLDSALPDEPLGHMVPAEPLQAALDAAMAAQDGLTHLAAARFETLETHAGHVSLSIEGGEAVLARLVIGADGMQSPVRHALNIPVEGRDYGKSVFTANVKLARPHDGIARQLFMPEGPFATLPLKGDRANLAWYLKRGAAEALAAMKAEEIEAELNTRFGGFAGEMQLDGPAGSYPLVLQLATQMVGPRAALIGDAARRVNPLAGQGLNQGFRDVAALAEVITQAAHKGLDVGAPSVLARYSEARRFEASSTALALDGIDRLFSNDSLLTKPLRTLGLLAAAKIGPLRRMLAQKASATESDVPESMQTW